MQKNHKILSGLTNDCTLRFFHFDRRPPHVRLHTYLQFVANKHFYFLSPISIKSSKAYEIHRTNQVNRIECLRSISENSEVLT